MSSIEVPHIHRAPHCRRRKSSELKAGRGRVDITKLKDTTSNRDLKELKSDVRIDRSAEEAVCQRTVDVSQETIPYHMDVRDIASEGRSLPCGEGPAWKRLLEKNNTRMMRKNIRLELKELIKTGDTANVPGEYFKPRLTVERPSCCEETGGRWKRNGLRKTG